MQGTPNTSPSQTLTDEETPASRPGIMTVVALGGAALAIAALVYAQELKAFLHLV